MQAATNSPRLGPSGGRSRSDSLVSQASTQGTPSLAGSTGMTPLLTNLAVTTGQGSPPTMTAFDLDGPVVAPTTSSTSTTTYQTSFRSNQEGGAPATGLGILMSSHNGTTNGGTASHTLHHQQHTLGAYNPEQRKLMQQDAHDRERQAQALAAAGLAAEESGASAGQESVGLYPPPTLGNPSSGIAHPTGVSGGVHISASHPGSAMDNWYNLGQPNPEGGPVAEPLTLEEMEMDFAKLFDPNVEWENMQTEGSGWPQLMQPDANGESALPPAAAEGTPVDHGGQKTG